MVANDAGLLARPNWRLVRRALQGPAVASSGRAPPPANGSGNAGSVWRSNSSAARGLSACSAQARRQLCQTSSRARFSTSSLVVFSQRHQLPEEPEQTLAFELRRHVAERLPIDRPVRSPGGTTGRHLPQALLQCSLRRGLRCRVRQQHVDVLRRVVDHLREDHRARRPLAAGEPTTGAASTDGRGESTSHAPTPC